MRTRWSVIATTQSVVVHRESVIGREEVKSIVTLGDFFSNPSTVDCPTDVAT